MYYFTSDEHYGHQSLQNPEKNVINYCKRPFRDIDDMNEALIANHNFIVKSGDIVVHGGDFCFWSNQEIVRRKYIDRLNGQHIFLYGSHDRWIKKPDRKMMWEKKIGDLYIVVCHYPMRSWPRSCHGSILLFGHTHGRMEPLSNQYDICVDANGFFPVSEEYIHKAFSKNGEFFATSTKL